LKAASSLALRFTSSPAFAPVSAWASALLIVGFAKSAMVHTTLISH
jgi:hypothetical protein